jgi:hypothetical protein
MVNAGFGNNKDRFVGADKTVANSNRQILLWVRHFDEPGNHKRANW